MDFIQLHWSDLLSLLFSSIAIFVALKSWQKSRSIYNLEFVEFLPDKIRDVGNKELRDKLNSGEYTILHADYRAAQYNLLIGKIKK